MAAPAVQEISLPGLRVALKKPRVVAEGVGYCWYPDLLQFATGELMLTYSLNADANANPHNSQAVAISDDGGETWGLTYDVNGFHNAGGEVRFGLPDGSIVGTSTFLKPDPPGQWRRFAAHYWRYENGGRSYAVRPWGAHVEGLPSDVEPWPTPSRTWWASINWYGDAVAIEGGRYITTLCLRFQGDPLHSTVALISEDRGRTWHYLSTVAGPDAVPDAKEGFDEPCMIRLADGDLMCVSRVGSYQPLARTYSSDGGKTWSPVDRLPALSVAPNMVQLANGVIAVSTGRPGLDLWLSTDPRGQNWESIDVREYHNTVLDTAHELRLGKSGFDAVDPVQTTAYTALLEVSPNRLFLVYDRMPYGWLPVPTEAEQRSRIVSHYPTASPATASLVPAERERIYLLEMEIDRT